MLNPEGVFFFLSTKCHSTKKWQGSWGICLRCKYNESQMLFTEKHYCQLQRGFCSLSLGANVFIGIKALSLMSLSFKKWVVKEDRKRGKEMGKKRYKRAVERERCSGGETINNLYIMIQTAPVLPLQSPHQTGGNESFIHQLTWTQWWWDELHYLLQPGDKGAASSSLLGLLGPTWQTLQNCWFHLCTWESLVCLSQGGGPWIASGIWTCKGALWVCWSVHIFIPDQNISASNLHRLQIPDIYFYWISSQNKNKLQGFWPVVCS